MLCAGTSGPSGTKWSARQMRSVPFIRLGIRIRIPLPLMDLFVHFRKTGHTWQAGNARHCAAHLSVFIGFIPPPSVKILCLGEVVTPPPCLPCPRGPPGAPGTPGLPGDTGDGGGPRYLMRMSDFWSIYSQKDFPEGRGRREIPEKKGRKVRS